MPLLLIISVIISIYIFTLPGASAGNEMTISCLIYGVFTENSVCSHGTDVLFYESGYGNHGHYGSYTKQR